MDVEFEASREREPSPGLTRAVPGAHPSGRLAPFTADPVDRSRPP